MRKLLVLTGVFLFSLVALAAPAPAGTDADDPEVINPTWRRLDCDQLLTGAPSTKSGAAACADFDPDPGYQNYGNAICADRISDAREFSATKWYGSSAWGTVGHLYIDGAVIICPNLRRSAIYMYSETLSGPSLTRVRHNWNCTDDNGHWPDSECNADAAWWPNHDSNRYVAEWLSIGPRDGGTTATTNHHGDNDRYWYAKLYENMVSQYEGHWFGSSLNSPSFVCTSLGCFFEQV